MLLRLLVGARNAMVIANVDWILLFAEQQHPLLRLGAAMVVKEPMTVMLWDPVTVMIEGTEDLDVVGSNDRDVEGTYDLDIAVIIYSMSRRFSKIYLSSRFERTYRTD